MNRTRDLSATRLDDNYLSLESLQDKRVKSLNFFVCHISELQSHESARNSSWEQIFVVAALLLVIFCRLVGLVLDTSSRNLVCSVFGGE